MKKTASDLAEEVRGLCVLVGSLSLQLTGESKPRLKDEHIANALTAIGAGLLRISDELDELEQT